MTPLPYRVGYGFDLHRLESGHPLILGGVRIAHDPGPAGHSDGDVVCHAITDALLGGIGAPDIGELFPDTDPQWEAADSRVFVREALRRVRTAGYAINNADVVVLLQRPKLRPHKAAIRAHLVDLLGCHEDQVNVKAKTHERVDSVGEGRAVACHAVVMLAYEGVPQPPRSAWV